MGCCFSKKDEATDATQSLLDKNGREIRRTDQDRSTLTSAKPSTAYQPVDQQSVAKKQRQDEVSKKVHDKKDKNQSTTAKVENPKIQSPSQQSPPKPSTKDSVPIPPNLKVELQKKVENPIDMGITESSSENPTSSDNLSISATNGSNETSSSSSNTKSGKRKKKKNKGRRN